MSDLPPAGWYPDPEDAAQQRYWDGTQWTEHRAPAAGSAGASTTPAQSDAGTNASSASTTPTSGPSDPWGARPTAVQPVEGVDAWLWQSIVVTVLGFVCCLFSFFITGLSAILGGIGIVFAAQSNTAKAAGDRTQAETKARTARILTLVGVGFLVLGLVVFVLLLVTGFADFRDGFDQFQDFDQFQELE